MAKEVYILYDGTYDDREVVAVFPTKEKAQEYMEKNLEKESCVRCEGTGKIEPNEWNKEGVCMMCGGVGYTYGDYAFIEDAPFYPEED